MLGLIGIKIGMTQIFNKTGEVVPVTAVRIEPHTVIACRTEEKEGYNAILLGSGAIKAKRVSKPYAGQFSDGRPYRHLFELRNFEKKVETGDVFGVDLFEDVPFIDVTGTSKGKGTQGVMKRWGFKGGPATHGSKFHRAHGSTGMAATPSKVFKGTKMAGRMGNERVTIQNLRVIEVDFEKKILLIKGAVPGGKNASLLLCRSKKKSGQI